MLWSFCAPKGGVGVSTIAAAVGASLSARRATVLVDVVGDLPDIFGVTSTGPGLREWLVSDASVDAVDELGIPIGDQLMLVPAGAAVEPSAALSSRAAQLAQALQRDDRAVVADLGVIDTDGLAPGPVIAAASGRTTLVLRACYLCLRRARDLQLGFDDVIEVVEGGRALTTIDIEGVLGRPVDHRLVVDPAIARCVDAGRMADRPPRSLRRLASSLDRRAPEMA